MSSVVGVAVDAVHHQIFDKGESEQAASPPFFIDAAPCPADDGKILKLFVGCGEDDVAVFLDDDGSTFGDDGRVVPGL